MFCLVKKKKSSLTKTHPPMGLGFFFFLSFFSHFQVGKVIKNTHIHISKHITVR